MSILIIFLVILAGCKNVNETQSACNIDEQQLIANEVLAKKVVTALYPLTGNIVGWSPYGRRALHCSWVDC